MTDDSDNTRWTVTGASKKGRNQTYHVDRDCRYLSDSDPVPVSDSAVAMRNLQACQTCGPGTHDYGTRRDDPVKCPKCGERPERLGHHLRRCDGGDENE